MTLPLLRPTPTRNAVAEGLLAGLGAEDISVRAGIPLERVRSAIAQMRRQGELGVIVKLARGRHPNTPEGSRTADR